MEEKNRREGCISWVPGPAGFQASKWEITTAAPAVPLFMHALTLLLFVPHVLLQSPKVPPESSPSSPAILTPFLVLLLGSDWPLPLWPPLSPGISERKGRGDFPWLSRSRGEAEILPDGFAQHLHSLSRARSREEGCMLSRCLCPEQPGPAWNFCLLVCLLGNAQLCLGLIPGGLRRPYQYWELNPGQLCPSPVYYLLN